MQLREWHKISRLRKNKIHVFSPSTNAHKSLARPASKLRSYKDRRFWCSYILFIITIGGILVTFIHITRLVSKEILSSSNKIHRELRRAKNLSALRYNATYKDGTPARSHGDRTALDNASGGACVKGILILVILSKSATFVVQTFEKSYYVYFVDTLHLQCI
jgi:hypothetical protein